jgi:hypothetical protein
MLSGGPEEVLPTWSAFAYFHDLLTRLKHHAPDRIHQFIPREWQEHFAPQSPANTATARCSPLGCAAASARSP